jgi:hypothetical protein
VFSVHFLDKNFGKIQLLPMQKPVAVCTNCRNFIYNMTLINVRCGQRPDGKNRCQGSNESALNYTDWTECVYCIDGMADGKRCEACQSSGWNYIRK